MNGVEYRSPEGRSKARARIVAGADGRSSYVTSAVRAATQESEVGARGLYYRYVKGLEGPEGEPDGAEFSHIEDEILYVFPSDAGRTCVP